VLPIFIAQDRGGQCLALSPIVFSPACFAGETMFLILLSLSEKSWEKEWQRRKEGKARG